jgi:hypothetical protein
MLLMWKSIDGSRRSTGLMFRWRKSSQPSSLLSSQMKTAATLICNFWERISKRPCQWRTCHLFILDSRTIMSTSPWSLARVTFSLLRVQVVAHQRSIIPRVISNFKEAT